MGNLYLVQNDLKNARQYYQRALEADPSFVVALTNTAWIDAVEGDLDVALSMAQKARSLRPDDPAIADTLAWVMYKKGNFSGAIPRREECIKKSPDSAQFHYHLGLALLAGGQKNSAKTQLQTALRIDKLRPAEKEIAHHRLAQLDE